MNMYLYVINPSLCLIICLSVCLFVCLSVCLFIFLSVSPSVCLSFCLSVCLSVLLSGTPLAYCVLTPPYPCWKDAYEVLTCHVVLCTKFAYFREILFDIWLYWNTYILTFLLKIYIFTCEKNRYFACTSTNEQKKTF